MQFWNELEGQTIDGVYPLRRLVRSELSTQPPVDPTLQAAVRRTVILAHSAGYAESPNGKKKPR